MPGATAFSAYCSQVLRIPRLSAEQALRAVAAIHAGEEGRWCALLDSKESRKVVASVLKGQSLGYESWLRDKPSRRALAAELKERDIDRLLIRAAECRVLSNGVAVDLKHRVGDAAMRVGRLRDDFITANLRLVLQVSRPYFHSGVEPEDLVAEGNLGLIRAVDRFSPKHSTQFSSYAAIWIRQALNRYLSTRGYAIRIKGTAYRVRKEALLAMEDEGLQNIEDIADRIGSSPTAVRNALMAGKVVTSIDEDRGGTALPLLYKTASSDPDPLDLLIKKEEGSDIHSSLDSLPAANKRVLMHRFGLNGHEESTLSTIGRSVGLTKERIRQIEGLGISKLRMILDHRWAVRPEAPPLPSA